MESKENIQQNINQIALEYKKIIDKFKNRFDVQNGWALAYRAGQNPNNDPTFENTPKSIGQGLTTTGWCVSASQALLIDLVFADFLSERGAYAKLISIDIKEQYYGRTYTGTSNKWHTAILVKDSGVYFIIDLTCAQFGNKYIGKDIWDFATWEKTFRSPLDKHVITDTDNNELSFLPKHLTNTVNNINNNAFNVINIKNSLNDIVTITDFERDFLANFFGNEINNINIQLEMGLLNKLTYKYLSKLNTLLQELDFVKISEAYTIVKFSNKKILLDWIKNFIDDGCINKQYLLISNSLSDACLHADIDISELHKEAVLGSENNLTTTGNYYVIFEFENISGIDVSFLPKTSMLIPNGIKFNVDLTNGIYNSGKLSDTLNLGKKTNTIIIKATNN
jgi:hypothetical protein